MKTPEEQIRDFTIYLKKLITVVTNESSFSLGNQRIISKSRIDDVLCCVQASYPKEHKEYVKRNGAKSLQSYVYLQQLCVVVTNKFVLSLNHYMIDYAMFTKIINTLLQIVKKENKSITEDNHFKL